MSEITVALKHVSHTDSIVLGYNIGSAKLPHGRKMNVIAAGKTVRFTIDGIDGYVDIDLSEIARASAILLTKGDTDA
jgi:hypothetical protein